jgi:hypothetical protein
MFGKVSSPSLLSTVCSCAPLNHINCTCPVVYCEFDNALDRSPALGQIKEGIAYLCIEESDVSTICSLKLQCRIFLFFEEDEPHVESKPLESVMFIIRLASVNRTESKAPGNEGCEQRVYS